MVLSVGVVVDDVVPSGVVEVVVVDDVDDAGADDVVVLDVVVVEVGSPPGVVVAGGCAPIAGPVATEAAQTVAAPTATIHARIVRELGLTGIS